MVVSPTVLIAGSHLAEPMASTLDALLLRDPVFTRPPFYFRDSEQKCGAKVLHVFNCYLNRWPQAPGFLAADLNVRAAAIGILAPALRCCRLA